MAPEGSLQFRAETKPTALELMLTHDDPIELMLTQDDPTGLPRL